MVVVAKRKIKRWPLRGRRRPKFPRPVRNRVHLEEYEHALILADLRELTGDIIGVSVSVRRLMDHAPMRYDARHLGAALRRLHQRGLVRYSRSRWTPFAGGGTVSLQARDPRRLAA